MPRSNLNAKSTTNAMRKNTIMVRRAMKSSVFKGYAEMEGGSKPVPNGERPNALRMIASKCSRTAVVAGEVVAADSTDEREVAVERIGVGS